MGDMNKDHMRYICSYDSPIGGMTMASDGENLTALWFDGQKYFMRGAEDPDRKSLPVFSLCSEYLDVYFSGKEPSLAPPLLLQGTDFQQMIWKILLTIPYGKTVTYGEIAKEAAKALSLKSMSAQAVGGAVGRNPVSIIVPCHRVLGSDGSLTGYAGGTDKKRYLLQLEGI